MDRAHRLRWTVVTGVALLGIAALTLVPAPGSVGAIRATPWWCVRCGAAGSADLFQNLLLFLPVGFALGRRRVGRNRAAIFLLSLPLLIELSQALWITGRDATLGDVLSNASGGMLGWWLGSRARLLSFDMRHGWRGAALLFGLFVAQLFATASLVRPSLDGPTPWQLRVSPQVVGKPVYHGTVMMLGQNGRAILTASDAKSQMPLGTHLTWLAQLTWQTTDSGAITPVLRLDDERGWPLFALDLRTHSAGVEVRTRGSAWQWRSPTWGIPFPATLAEHDTLVIQYLQQPGSVELRSTSHGTTRVERYPLGAQHGWSLINPFTPIQNSPSSWHRWTLAWLFGWGLLLGASAALSARAWPWGLAALFALGGGTYASGTPIGVDEGAALLVGWTLGCWISSRRQGHPSPVAVAHTTSHPPREPERPSP